MSGISIAIGDSGLRADLVGMCEALPRQTDCVDTVEEGVRFDAVRSGCKLALVGEKRPLTAAQRVLKAEVIEREGQPREFSDAATEALEEHTAGSSSLIRWIPARDDPDLPPSGNKARAVPPLSHAPTPQREGCRRTARRSRAGPAHPGLGLVPGVPRDGMSREKSGGSPSPARRWAHSGPGRGS